MTPKFTFPIQSFSLNSRLINPASLYGCKIDIANTTSPKLNLRSSHHSLLTPQVRAAQQLCPKRLEVLQTLLFFLHFTASHFHTLNPVDSICKYISNNFSPRLRFPPSWSHHPCWIKIVQLPPNRSLCFYLCSRLLY